MSYPIEFRKKVLKIKEKDSDKFELLLEEDVDKRIKKIISREESSFTRSTELNKDIYIETNLSANKILSNIKLIYDFLGIQEPQLSYVISIVDKK